MNNNTNIIPFIFMFTLIIALIFGIMWGVDKSVSYNYIQSNCTILYHNITETTCGRFSDSCYKASVGLYSIWPYIGYIIISKFGSMENANEYLDDKYPIDSNIKCWYNSNNYEDIILAKVNNYWVLGLWATFLIISVVGPLIFIHYKDSIINKFNLCCRKRHYETLDFY